ncbi:MAG: DUF5675 family protein [Clostridia bacterium]|nr:DUF5675 family protein [Clostridia bacterium]
MNILLDRKYLKENYTIGKLHINDVYFCDTLEDKVVDVDKSGKIDNGEVKIYGQTAIPYGKYKVVLSYSPKFGRIMPRILDVPGFNGILIHIGNTIKDTDGCILVGRNKTVGMVNESTTTFNELFRQMEVAEKKGENITINII